MTNYDKWLSYTDGLPSPDSYRKWGWLFLISAALQRRVWCPPAHDPLYPNIYPILVGEAGIGKGGVIRAVNSILTQYELKVEEPKVGLSPDEQTMAKAIAEADLKSAVEELMKVSNKSSVGKVPLLPSGGDAVTYEALVQAMARSLRRINYTAFDEKLQKDKMNVYGHSSMYFSLEELASLFRKNTESLMVFLNQAYDCAEEYKYKTKTGGEDRIHRVCLSILAGTTPDFMQSIFSEALVNQGFSSRAFFIFALKNRKTMFFRPELTAEQKQHREEIIAYVKTLTSLYGQIKIDQSTFQYLEDWMQKDVAHPELRASKSAKLKTYYSRKNIHIMKVGMALHFGESTEMHIPTETFIRAIELLHEEEKTMALALMMGNDNPLAKPSRKIVDYLRDTGKKNFNELLAEFWEQGLRKVELEEVLNYLCQVDKIVTRQEKDEDTQETHMYYKLKE